MDRNLEFNRQLQTLIQKGYPDKARLSTEKFIAKVEPLRAHIEQLPQREPNIEIGYLPFVIVVKSNLVVTETAMSLVDKNNKNGITKLFPHDSHDFKTIDDVTVPDSDVYLLLDIDRGKENINLPPQEAMGLIKAQHRMPLTIDEGVAIVTQYPDFLIKNNCFSLLASRHQGDQRVPAIWINAQKQPNLGWCWDGNPHTWLGSASCSKRI